MSGHECDTCEDTGATLDCTACECWRDVVFMVDRTSDDPDELVDVTEMFPRTTEEFEAVGLPAPSHVFVFDGESISREELDELHSTTGRDAGHCPPDKEDTTIRDMSIVVMLVLFLAVGAALGWLYGSAP